MSAQCTVELYGRSYALPSHPTVVVCIDGFDPEYLQAGIEDGILPNLASWVKNGFHATAKSAMPSLTNPNNLSIITGAPTVAHGVAGNYFLDKASGKEVMLQDDSTMYGSTILELLAQLGVRIAAITAKDKLRRIINHGLSPSKGSICFSSQYAKDCTTAVNGVDDVETWIGRTAPAQYSADLSLFVLDAGVKVLEEKRADVLYLTLSDYIQHKFAPRSAEADDFMHQIDARLGTMQQLGATVVVTGDHGMSDKSLENGEPNVLFLEDALLNKWPEAKARVICPIADPFMKHHGAFGGFVRVHLLGKHDTYTVNDMLDYCRALPAVEVAYTGPEAAKIFEMPADREGDLVVISKENAAIGGRKDEHDMEQLKGHRLRTHGGLSEQDIPLIRSRPLGIDKTSLTTRQWRNFDAFDLALNY